LTEVVRFKEVAPAIFFPEQIESRKKAGDASTVRSFTEVRVNQPMPAHAYDFRFPAGTEVTDEVQNKVFKAQEDGQIVHMKHLRIVPFTQIAPAPDAVRGVTREEPTGRTRWILPVGLFFLAMGGCIYLWRKWRNRSAVAA
jgi:hypothetical protein